MAIAAPAPKYLSEGLDDLHKQLTAKDYRYYKPCVEIAPWNAKTMELSDPFGNKLLFSESLDQ